MNSSSTFAPTTRSFGSRQARYCAPRDLIAASATTPSRRSAPHGNRLLLRLSGVADRDGADALRGSVFVIDSRTCRPSTRPTPTTTTSSKVFGCAPRPAANIGAVAEVLHTAAGELLAVKREQAPELLVPFVSAIVTWVSLEDGVVDIDPPDGLLDLEM